MRWLTFGICALVVVTLQLTLAPRIELFGARPDWCLVLVVFFALHARTPDPLLGAWMVGALLDLMSVGRLGLLSLSYALVALAVYAVRDYFYGNHLLTHVCVTLGAALLLQLAHGLVQLVLYEAIGESWTTLAARGCWAAVYTAAWAPLVHRLLLKRPRTLGIRAPVSHRR